MQCVCVCVGVNVTGDAQIHQTNTLILLHSAAVMKYYNQKKFMGGKVPFRPQSTVDRSQGQSPSKQEFEKHSLDDMRLCQVDN